MATTTDSTKTNMQIDSKSQLGSEESNPERLLDMSLTLEGLLPADYKFLVVMCREVVLETIWEAESNIMLEKIPMNLNNSSIASLLIDTPVVLLLRAISKSTKEYDPLLHPDNRAGANVDLLPVMLGEESYSIKVDLKFMDTGDWTGCSVEIFFDTNTTTEARIPVLLTMINASCLPPPPKDDTCYIAAINFDGLCEPSAVNFGVSSSTYEERLKWTSINVLDNISKTDYFFSREDCFIPSTIDVKTDKEECLCEFWNSCRRLLIDSSKLIERLNCPFFIEIAGIPKKGKLEVRDHYMGYVDAGVLLQPGESSVTVSAKLSFFDESELPENITTLLDLPPSKSKIAAIKEVNSVFDMMGHTTYITIRFDLFEPLIPKVTIIELCGILGFADCDEPLVLTDDFREDPVPEDHTVDTKRIRKECGALAVHSELCGITSLCSTLNQSTKRAAANHLLGRVKTMLKQFLPDSCTSIDWQDIVRGQHSASRRAVTASFAPQPPPKRLPSLFAAARARMAGDCRIADVHTKMMMMAAPNHSRSILANILRRLEMFDNQLVHKILLQVLNSEKNKYFLWIYGALEFDQGPEEINRSYAAFRIAVKNHNTENVSKIIGWAALHALHHYNGKYHAAFAAAKKMRSFFQLPCDWQGFVQRWYNNSGEEESLWNPNIITTNSPFIVASAFFLCLRSYAFSAQLLKCYDMGCDKRGSRLTWKASSDMDRYYLQAASLLLRNLSDKALAHTEKAIVVCGPVANLCQMQAMCLLKMRGWDKKCEAAFHVAEKEGAEPLSAVLLQAALAYIKSNTRSALQYAARAHELTPCGHSAFIISRIYEKLNEEKLAKRWASAAVRLEMFLSDAWAMLALITMRENEYDQALILLHTARQAGPITHEITQDLENLMATIPLKVTPEILFQNTCFCHYYK